MLKELNNMEKQQWERIYQGKLEENTCKSQMTAERFFPNEQWIEAAMLKLKYEEVPHGIENIKIARSRLSKKKDDEKTLVKELSQAKILADNGSSIFLLPKLKDPHTKYFKKGPDAIVNGTLYEFKTITGPISKVERNFRHSRKQCENAFLRIMDPAISKDAVISKMRQILNDKTYNGGAEGSLIVHFEEEKKTYFLRIKDLK